MSRARSDARPVDAARPLRGRWPYVVLATLAVAVLPVLLVSALQTLGVPRSPLAALGIAAALSVAVSITGAALWSRRLESRDLVFADLMLWGWIRRLRTERRLADARSLLGDREGLSSSRQAQLLEQLSAALEARDAYTHGHSRRVTRYSEAIARGLGLARDEVARIRTAAAVHDAGKIRTPREVLNKPGPLSDEEFATVKRHPVDGAELVAEIGDPELTAMVRHHHERLDGRGYPDGLAGSEIPLGARIIAVADTFDAITSTRPYRAGGRHKNALDILRREAGEQLDPDAVAAFLSYYSGRRSVAWWSVVLTEPPRFAYWLLGWLQGAGATPLAKGAAAAGVTALIGGSVAGPAAGDAGVRAQRAGQALAQRAEGDAQARRRAPAVEPARESAGEAADRRERRGRGAARSGASGRPASGARPGSSGGAKEGSDPGSGATGGSGGGSGAADGGGGSDPVGGRAARGGSDPNSGGSGRAAPPVEMRDDPPAVKVDVPELPPVELEVPNLPPVKGEVPSLPPVQVEVPELPPVRLEVPEPPPVQVELPKLPRLGSG